MSSPNNGFNIGALKHAGSFAIILAIAVCVDVTVRYLVSKGLLDPTSFPYRCITTVATVIEFCHSVVLICIVIRHTWDELVDLFKLRGLFLRYLFKKSLVKVSQLSCSVAKYMHIPLVEPGSTYLPVGDACLCEWLPIVQGQVGHPSILIVAHHGGRTDWSELG